MGTGAAGPEKDPKIKLTYATDEERQRASGSQMSQRQAGPGDVTVEIKKDAD